MFKSCLDVQIEELIVLHQQVVSNSLNPRWKTVQIPVQQLCNGDYDRVVKVSGDLSMLFTVVFKCATEMLANNTVH